LIWRNANVKEAKIVDLIQNLKNQVKPLGKKVVLPEYQDERVLVATETILKEGFCTPVLVGNPAEIAEAAKAAGVSIEGAEIIDPANYPRYQEMVDIFVELRAKKGMTPEKADATMKGDCLFFGAMLVRLGEVDGMVAGSACPTANVLRAALQVVGTKPGLKTVSSTMVMFTNKKEYGDDGVLIFSDLSMLSFSTKGSASTPEVDKVVEAVNILKERNVDFKFDGELQLDASIVPSVAERKAPGSEVAGKANILIFPDLQSANIGYKLVQRFADAEAIGPLIQGLAAPIHDLSRGCSAQDIVEVAAITAVESI